MTTQIKAVIFDMDGTLLDTEKYYRIFWPKSFAFFGYEMTDAQALDMRSLGRPFVEQKVKQWFGEAIDYFAVREKRKELMEAYLDKEGIRCKPGAFELLEYLKKKHITTAIATATDLERTKKYLAGTGLLSYFDHIISATMVERGKPAPDVYLFACEKLGLSPKDCIAVEDSPNGVLSAYQAGCKVIMVPDQTQPDEKLTKCLFRKADSLKDLVFLLEEG